MIFQTHSYGDHSNRLFQSIHFEAYAKEHGRKYYNLSFRNMMRYYSIKDSFLLKTMEFFNKIKILRIIPTIDFSKRPDGTSEPFNKMLGRGVKCIKGFPENDNDELAIKYRSYFQQKYALQPKYYQNNSFIQQIDNQKETHTLVGIHIRRGDYREWAGGKYFFSDDVYEKFAMQLQDKIIARKPIQFVIFSNETITLELKDSILSVGNPWYIDQLALSKMDYIIGAYSSFTSWASYIGVVPLYHIKNKNQSLEMKDFTVCNG